MEGRKREVVEGYKHGSNRAISEDIEVRRKERKVSDMS